MLTDRQGRQDSRGITSRKIHEANEMEPKIPDKASCVVKCRLSASPTSVAIVFECSSCDQQGCDGGFCMGTRGKERPLDESSCRADDAGFASTSKEGRTEKGDKPRPLHVVQKSTEACQRGLSFESRRNDDLQLDDAVKHGLWEVGVQQGAFSGLNGQS